MMKKYSLVMAVVLIGAYGLEVKAAAAGDPSWGKLKQPEIDDLPALHSNAMRHRREREHWIQQLIQPDPMPVEADVAVLPVVGAQVWAGAQQNLNPRGGGDATGAAEACVIDDIIDSGREEGKKSRDIKEEWKDFFRNTTVHRRLMSDINKARFFQGTAYHSGWEDVGSTPQLLKTLVNTPPLKYDFLTRCDVLSTGYAPYARALLLRVMRYNYLFAQFKELDKRRNLPQEKRHPEEGADMFNTLQDMFNTLDSYDTQSVEPIRPLFDYR